MEKQASVVLVAAFYSLISAGIAERKARREFVRMLWDNGIKTGIQLMEWAQHNGRDGKTIIDQRWPRKKKDNSLLGPRSAMQSNDPEVALLGEVLYQVEHALIDYQYRETKNLKAQAVADARAQKDVHGREIAKAFGKEYIPKDSAPETPEATTPEATTPEATTPETPETPEATTPEATTPKATTPEATTPEATTPEATTQEATTQDAHLNDNDLSLYNAGRVDGISWAIQIFAEAQEMSQKAVMRIILSALKEEKEDGIIAELEKYFPGEKAA